jgi:hypothetical protein
MTCKICNKIVNNNSGLISHVKRKHNIIFDDYIKRYYVEDKPIEKCGNCNKNSFFIYRLDNENYTFTRYYKCGFFCNSIECKNDLSLKILGTSYDKKTYEHIGSNPKYLSIIKKITLEDAQYIVLPNRNKSGDNVPISQRTNLAGYIIRYGEIDGPIKYKERCDKIGKSNTLDWYINKFGYDIGKTKYESYLAKLIKVTTGTKISKVSQKIKQTLELYNIKYIEEYPIHILNKIRPKIVDFYLVDYNICLEFFGQFWHCDPRNYKKDYYHKLKKKYAYEIWKDDEIRNKQIIESTNGPLIILWENNVPEEKILIDIIKQLKIIKNIIYL